MMTRATAAPFILQLASEQATLDRAGGKGMNLSELARAGFDVPAGFIVTTDAYRDFVSANALQPRILDLAAKAELESPESLEAASVELRTLFEHAILPSVIEAAISTAYQAIEFAHGLESAVAVRSSATAEDLPGLSFAGQQDTYLNIIGADAVVDAVKRCWASLWSARAISYRARNHISPNDVSLAVVVQRMVDAESAGVLFTANPLTGNRHQMVIDASFGLGEALVSGEVEPDHYVVDARDGHLIERKTGAKALVILSKPEGGTQQVAQDNAMRQVLSDAQVLELAQIASRVEQHFALPQDIEWARANQRFHVLQSRPITSLYPLPAPDAPAEKKINEDSRVYFSFNSVQGVTDPFTPLGQDALRFLFGGIVALANVERSAREIILPAGDRLFINVTDIAHDPHLRKVFLAGLSAVDPGSRQIVARLIRNHQLEEKKALTPRIALRTVRALRPMISRAFWSMHKPEQAAQDAVAAAEQFVIEIEKRANQAPDLSSRLDVMEAELGKSLTFIARAVMSAVLPALLSMRLIDKWLTEWLGERSGAVLALTRGLPNNITTQMDLDLWAAAQVIRADPASLTAMLAQSIDAQMEAYRQGALPAPAQQALSAFLDRYGMRGLVEIDIGRPRWRDDPTPVLQTLRSYLQLNDASAAPDALFERGGMLADALAADYVARARKLRFGAVRARLLGALIRRLRLLAGLRELPKFLMVRILGAYREALLESSREMVLRGELDNAEDIFFVPLDALKAYADGEKIPLKQMVEARRAGYAFELQRRRMPRILLGNGEAYYDGIRSDEKGEGSLKGQAVSPGVVEGVVRVVHDPRQSHLQPGEILVCPATDPSWTPIFLAAGGLVMEIGGMMTHGSVVAREYGIPAVVGVHEATTRLRDGQRIRVDGNSGWVTILP